jgi:hypothetical protein
MMWAITITEQQANGQGAKMAMWIWQALLASTNVLLVNMELCYLQILHLEVGSTWQLVMHVIQPAKNVWVMEIISV